MRRGARFFLVAALAAMLSYSAANSQSDEAGGQDPCLAKDAMQLDLTQLWRGEFEKEQSQCFVLEMRQGSFARVRLGLQRGFILASLFAPADTKAVARIYVAENGAAKENVLAWEARASGNYLLRVEKGVPSQGVRVQLESLESPEIYAARAGAIKANPRVQSLSNHMLKLNSVDPEDDDFSDLLPLRERLEDVRIILLGEATHFDGSDFLAKGRLIRFLHSELGFDVLAFEAGIYQMRLAWEAFRAGFDPQKAFSKGAFWMWARSAQVEPLIRYVSQSLSTEQPLELAGIDNQIWGAELPQKLREFLKEKDIATPFANPNSPESEILAAMSEVRFRTGKQKRPDSAMKVRFVESLERAADEIGQLETTREVMFWQRVFVNMVQYARGPVLRILPRSERTAARERQMAENLIWMAKEYYPGRKIIVWCHSGHAMRSLNELPLDLTNAGVPEVTLGDRVWKVFGKEMYSIAPVSYEGRWAGRGGGEFTVVSDQVPEAEFEELMALTGETAALVDLRQINKRARWLAGSFVARPLDHVSVRGVWSHHFDAFLFLRTQEPSVFRKD
jgi:erythromycin esterase